MVVQAAEDVAFDYAPAALNRPVPRRMRPNRELGLAEKAFLVRFRFTCRNS
jgi:hypothetical protein